MTGLDSKGWSRSKLIATAVAELTRNPTLRFGQALYNVAYRQNPAVARLAGTEWDPTYDDRKTEAFLNKLGAVWD